MSRTGAIDSTLMALLACPRDHAPMQQDKDELCCPHGHRYPVADGIPVFILGEKDQTIGIASASLRAAVDRVGAPLYVDTLGLSEDEKRGIVRDFDPDAAIDAAISYLIGATSGFGYVGQIGRLERYPIPDIPIPQGAGGLLLDIGCNWGRWSVAAARKGWRPVGIDPSLGALMAARRAFAGGDEAIHYVCGDARYLPFRPNVFAAAFSYSVLQHFSEDDAEAALAEVGRVLAPGGFAKIQMAHAGGLRSRQIMRRKGYAASGPFRVRYWTLDRLRDVFSRCIGPAHIRAEAFGGLGLLAEDRDVVSARAKLLIAASVALRSLTRVAAPLLRLADSVYVEAVKR